MLPSEQKTEAIFLHPFSVCSLCKQKFVVCHFVDEETSGRYPFANGLNGLNGLARLCLLYILVPMDSQVWKCAWAGSIGCSRRINFFCLPQCIISQMAPPSLSGWFLVTILYGI